MDATAFAARRALVRRDCYEHVPDDHVPRAKRRAAAAALAYGVRDLALPPIIVRWFDVRRDFDLPPSAGDHILGGWCPSTPTPDTIYLRCACQDVVRRVAGVGGHMDYRLATRTPAQVARSVFHELQHARDNIDWGGIDDTDMDMIARSEANALAYEARQRQRADAMGAPNWPARRR